MLAGRIWTRWSSNGFRRMIRESRGRSDAALAELPDQEIAKALGAVEANHEVSAVRVLGLLLFGREDAIGSSLFHMGRLN